MGSSQTLPRGSEIGLGFQNRGILRYGVFQLSQHQIRARQIVTSFCVVRLDVKGCLEMDHRFGNLAALQVLELGLRVMDATAVSLCMDNHLPIVVFNLRVAGNVKRAVMGEPIGSLVTA